MVESAKGDSRSEENATTVATPLSSPSVTPSPEGKATEGKAIGEDKNSNTSFFAYTALIFVVAIIIVLLAFLGQRHTRIAEDGVDKEGNIVESTEQLSDENARLYDQITTLNTKIDELNGTIAERDATISDYENVIKAQNYFDAGDKATAKTYLDAVDTSRLTGEVKVTYDKLIQEVTE